MAGHAQEQADYFLRAGGHRAIAVADADEIDSEISTAVWDAYQAWGAVHRLLCKKRPSTLPQDGSSEGAVDDPAPSSKDLFAKLEAELKSKKK